MKYIILLLAVATLFSVIGCTPSYIVPTGTPVYLAHNMWYRSNKFVEAINFKGMPNFIPAGTQVMQVNVRSDRENNYIYFRLAEPPQTYFRLFINARYQTNGHDELTLQELHNRMFTEKTFDQLTAGFSSDEIENIRNGTIQQGMSKEAVLVSWGYPPLHQTPSIESDQWFYWKMRPIKTLCQFSKDGTLVGATWYGNGGNPFERISE